MKHKTITPKNFKKFKPSELIHSFISDIEIAIKMKKPMDMTHFTQRKNAKCLPCLGGMACLNWGLKYEKSDNVFGRLGFYISDLGDDIRAGYHPTNILRTIEKMYECEFTNNESYDFTTFVNKQSLKGVHTDVFEKEQFDTLKNNVMIYVKAFKHIKS